MAEPNTLEWMTEQRDRLKQEVDELSPKLDKVKDDLAKARGALQEANADRQMLARDLATTRQHLAAMADLINRVRKLLPKEE